MASAGLDDVVQLIQATLSQDAAARKAAEKSIESLFDSSGAGLNFVTITLDQSQPEEIRQLSVILLRKLVKERWSPESKHFREPVVQPDEKSSIRQSLPQGLGDRSAKVQTAVGLVVASIAKWDVPAEWPHLLPALLAVIQSRSDDNAGKHALSCR